MPEKHVCLIGERGLVSRLLQERFSRRPDIGLTLVPTESILECGALPALPEGAIVVLATTDFASSKVLAALPEDARVLDISPAFRTDPAWTYGLPELPGHVELIEASRRVANPGCFATSAILLLAPLITTGLIQADTCLYLDAVGGYTTGGHAMIERAEAGTLEATAIYSLTRPHRHIEEIQRFSGCRAAPLWFCPKIGSHARGIRMQIPLLGVDRDAALSQYSASFAGHDVVIHDDVPKCIPADVWAGKAGAGIWGIPQPHGVMLVCAIDNLGKGAVDSAIANLDTMLRGSARALRST
jgi:N-acetyl-gamma-glutamyl-phosphate reductase